MDKKKTVFMRIGSDKAGTVTLANLVDDNRELFRKVGFYAPMRNCMPLYDYLVKRGGLSSIDIFDPSRLPEKHRASMACFDQLINHPESCADTDVFLTTETFWGRLAKKKVLQCKNDIIALCSKIRGFFPGHNIHLILHLRRADLYYESLYKQGIKAGQTYKNGIQDLVRNSFPQNCLALLRILEECFDAENITIRPFERRQMRDGDFVSDTLALLGIENRSEFKITRANESLHRDLCETLIRLNRQHGKLLSNPDLLALNDVLTGRHAFPDVQSFLSRQERQAILAEFEEFYNYIEQNYRNGNALFQEGFPEDTHLDYRLSDSTFETIRDLIFQTHAQRTSLPETHPKL
jgi:hypothetical protein